MPLCPLSPTRATVARENQNSDWLDPSTQMKIAVGSNPHERTSFLAQATVNFRLMGIEPDPERMGYATFEGSGDIYGAIDTQWRW